jgi:chemotaxis protein methyltransferase CheR
MNAVGTEALGEADFTRFRELVLRSSGMELSEVRRSELERAVYRMVERAAMSGPSELYEHLSARESAVDLEAFVAELTIGETYFFRHKPQFEALEHEILPDLIARRARERRLRVWSAGCATGEEPYSLAILLDRVLPDRQSWNVMILGTDINRGSLERAQRGWYRPWSFRGVDPAIEARYFTRSGSDYRIRPEISHMVTFSYLNLVEDAYPTLATNTQSMDLILCRNVLIYFGQGTIGRVLGRLYDSLCENGWLVSGPADASAEGYARFEVRALSDAIVYRRGPRTAAAPPPALPVAAPAHSARTDRPAPLSRRTAPTRMPHMPAEGPSPDLLETVELWKAGRAEEATHRLVELDAAEPANPWPAYAVGKIFANERRLGEALSWADRALARDGTFAPGHYLRGLVLGESGDLRSATDAIRRCVYLDPGFVVGQYALAGFFARLGETERAIKAIENVIRGVGELEHERPVPEGDGLTAGRLLELAAVQRGLLLHEERDAEDDEPAHA